MPSALDLFAGAGGLSLGLKQAGIDVVGAIELDRFAVETYGANFSNSKVHQKRLEDCSDQWLRRKFSGVEIVAGGPPCQGFSVAGPSQYRRLDDRNGLVLEMARVVRTLRPRFALLENVKGILSGRVSEARKAIEAYTATLSDHKYTSKVVRLQAANYGVPQNRERVFVVSSLDGLEPLEGIVNLLTTRAAAFVPAAHCFTDLPALEPGTGSDQPVPYASEPQNTYQVKAR